MSTSRFKSRPTSTLAQNRPYRTFWAKGGIKSMPPALYLVVGGLRPAADNLGPRNRFRGSGLFEQSVEEHPSGTGSASVEPEGELLEVRLEVIRADRPLMGPKKPALEQARDPMDARHRDMRRIAR